MIQKWKLCPAPACFEVVPPEFAFCPMCWVWLSRRLQDRIAEAWVEREERPGKLARYVEIAKRRIAREKKAAEA